MKGYLRFSAQVTAAHVVTYISAGVLAYAFLTGGFFDGSNELVNRVMRTPAEPALWNHVTRWMLAFQVLRGVLMALVLYPFLPALRPWSYAKRAVAIAGLHVVFGQWASTVAGSGTIEGWLILRPEYTAPSMVVKAMIEGMVQGVAFAAWIARSAVVAGGAQARAVP
jgi:hypothetical protein